MNVDFDTIMNYFLIGAIVILSVLLIVMFIGMIFLKPILFFLIAGFFGGSILIGWIISSISEI